MKIYSKGFSDKNIDYIAERKLRAIITKEYAIVTIAEDERTHEDLREYLSVSESYDKYFSIFFSPEMLVPDLQYILQSEQEQINTKILIQDFKDSFFARIIEIAEQSGNLTRAEVTRLIWQKFSSTQSVPFNNVDEDDKKGMLSQVEKEVDKKWICDKFVELILKYAIYITCWEKTHGKGAVQSYNAKHLGKKDDLENEYVASIAHQNTISNWFRNLLGGEETISDKNIPESVKKMYKELDAENVTKSIEEDVYTQCKIQIDRNADIYRKFFFRSHDADKRDLVKLSLFELILFSNTFAYSWYLQYQKEEVLKFLLDETEHIGNIADVIDINTTSAVEIVLMNIVKVNQNIEDDKSWVNMHSESIENAVRIANKLQLYVIPATMVLLKKNEYKDELPIEDMIESLHKNNDVIVRISERAEERKDSLKKKDGGNTLGNFHMFASENTEILDAIKMDNETKGNILVNRSKSKERNYWTQRKRELITENVKEGDSETDDLVRKYLEYISYQNKVIRNYVRDYINSLINSEI